MGYIADAWVVIASVFDETSRLIPRGVMVVRILNSTSKLSTTLDKGKIAYMVVLLFLLNVRQPHKSPTVFFIPASFDFLPLFCSIDHLKSTMKYRSALVFPASLALIWGATGPFSYAAPPPLPKSSKLSPLYIDTQ
jgi:hypothetical protein